MPPSEGKFFLATMKNEANFCSAAERGAEAKKRMVSLAALGVIHSLDVRCLTTAAISLPTELLPAISRWYAAGDTSGYGPPSLHLEKEAMAQKKGTKANSKIKVQFCQPANRKQRHLACVLCDDGRPGTQTLRPAGGPIGGRVERGRRKEAAFFFQP